MANIYDKVPIKVQKKSGFDKSFQSLFTGKVGQIIPVMCDEVIPNTTVNLKLAMTTQLPPLASDTFMRVKQKYAAFFVPTRIIMAGFENWLTGNTLMEDASSHVRTPLFRYSLDKYKAGCLADFLGLKLTKGKVPSSSKVIDINALPFLAYHRIYEDWFRNSLVQRSIYLTGAANGAPSYSVRVSNRYVPNDKSANGYLIKDQSPLQTSDGSDIFADGVRLGDLRQANFGIDLFTSATPSPQNGESQAVSFVSASEPELTSFTISALRAANSMQQFLERNNLAGNRLVDYVKAQYGANLNDAIAQRAVLLGSGSFDVYSKGIYQTATQAQNESVTSNNPFGSVGTRYGSAYADGSDFVIKGFTAQEPGYVFVVTWLSPKVTYSTGIDPVLLRYRSTASQSDMANPILQNVGNEPILRSMISAAEILADDGAVFGYNDRYFAWKDKQDEVHGLLRDEESLQSFALQRTFADGGAVISSEFLRIPVDYLDQVAAVSGNISSYGYWCDTYLDYKVSMPLARYSVPSLQDPAYEHGEDIVVSRGGKQIQ